MGSGIEARLVRRFDHVGGDTHHEAAFPDWPVLDPEIQAGQGVSRRQPVKTFVFHVVIEEDPFEDGRMAYAAYVPEWKPLDTECIPPGSLRAMPWMPESRLRHCVIPVPL